MKSITTQLNLDQVIRKLASFFSQAEEVAHETRFVQRKSPLNGLSFIQALVVGFLKHPTASLNQLARECAQLGIAISPQGLHERINDRSLAFLKAMYQIALQQFKNQQALPMAILQQFTQILLIDSTFESLPESMQTRFPGSGGNASSASLKVQLVFEFLCGNLLELVVEAGRAADQAYTQYLDWVQRGSLVIMDLGYFRLASLHAIAQKSAYFILRYHYPTALSDLTGMRLDLFALLQRTQRQADLDISVLVGASHKPSVACRLIAIPLPVAVAEERRRVARRNAVKRRKPLSQAYLQSLGWSIFLTNVPHAMLSMPQVLAFYHIRWQIELIFKFWKSYCGLDHLPAVREVRVMTEFYAKLLVAVLSNFFIAPIRLPDEACPQHEISPFQVRKILADFAQDLIVKLFDPSALYPLLEHLYQRILRYGCKQIRREKPNALAMLAGLSIQQAAS